MRTGRGVRAFRRTNAVLFNAAVASAVLAFVLGGFFVAQPEPDAFVGPVYDNLRAVMPLWLWGTLFLVKGALAIAALFVRRTWSAVSTVAFVGGLLYVGFASVFVLTAARNHWVGFLGAVFIAFIAAAHINLARASLRDRLL